MIKVNQPRRISSFMEKSNRQSSVFSRKYALKTVTGKKNFLVFAIITV